MVIADFAATHNADETGEFIGILLGESSGIVLGNPYRATHLCTPIDGGDTTLMPHFDPKHVIPLVTTKANVDFEVIIRTHLSSILQTVDLPVYVSESIIGSMSESVSKGLCNMLKPQKSRVTVDGDCIFLSETTLPKIMCTEALKYISVQESKTITNLNEFSRKIMHSIEENLVFNCEKVLPAGIPGGIPVSFEAWVCDFAILGIGISIANAVSSNSHTCPIRSQPIFTKLYDSSKSQLRLPFSTIENATIPDMLFEKEESGTLTETSDDVDEITDPLEKSCEISDAEKSLKLPKNLFDNGSYARSAETDPTDWSPNYFPNRINDKYISIRLEPNVKYWPLFTTSDNKGKECSHIQTEELQENETKENNYWDYYSQSYITFIDLKCLKDDRNQEPVFYDNSYLQTQGLKKRRYEQPRVLKPSQIVIKNRRADEIYLNNLEKSTYNNQKVVYLLACIALSACPGVSISRVMRKIEQALDKLQIKNEPTVVSGSELLFEICQVKKFMNYLAIMIIDDKVLLVNFGPRIKVDALRANSMKYIGFGLVGVQKVSKIYEDCSMLSDVEYYSDSDSSYSD